jgi:hypothetical protein
MAAMAMLDCAADAAGNMEFNSREQHCKTMDLIAWAGVVKAAGLPGLA